MSFVTARRMAARTDFELRCIEADVPGRAHGLRKAGATIAPESGATAHQLKVTFGWRRWIYTERVRQQVLAGGRWG